MVVINLINSFISEMAGNLITGAGASNWDWFRALDDEAKLMLVDEVKEENKFLRQALTNSQK